MASYSATQGEILRDASLVRDVHNAESVRDAGQAGVLLFMRIWPILCRAVDRRFNRARYDADAALTAFAARLKDGVDLDSIRDDLATVVHQALEPQMSRCGSASG